MIFWAIHGVVRPHDDVAPVAPVVPVAPVGSRVHADEGRKQDLAYQREARRTKHTPAPAATAAQVMTSPVLTLSPSDTVGDALALVRLRGFRHIPIAEDGRLLGIVSDRDLLRRADDRLLAGVMRKRVLIAAPESDLRTLARGIVEHHVNAFPVTDDQLLLLGIVTTTDLLRALVNSAKLELWA